MSEVPKEVAKLQKKLSDNTDLMIDLSKRLQESENCRDKLRIEIGELLGWNKELGEMLDQSSKWNDEAWGRISKTQNVLVEMEKSRIESVRTGVPMKRLSWDVSAL